MRGSCGDSGTYGTVCDQYMVWERRSCDTEIHWHITVVAWGRQTRISMERMWDSIAVYLLLGNMLLRRISNSPSPVKLLSALSPVINKNFNGIDINPWDTTLVAGTLPVTVLYFHGNDSRGSRLNWIWYLSHLLIVYLEVPGTLLTEIFGTVQVLNVQTVTDISCNISSILCWKKSGCMCLRLGFSNSLAILAVRIMMYWLQCITFGETITLSSAVCGGYSVNKSIY